MKDYSNDDLAALRSESAVAHSDTDRLFWNPSSASLMAFYAENLPAQAPSEGVYRKAGKRALDISLVVLSLPVVLPVVALLAVALWIESGLPFYRQDRLGRDGKRFSILKLRTMVRNADTMLESLLQRDAALSAEWNATQKLKADPRITRIGGFLRATSLDELPQLWNVLIGEMSLVGPRPMLPEQLPLYGNATAYFSLRPGVTGPWQVSDRNENRFEYRATVDARYANEVSLSGDVHVLMQTVGVVVRGTGY